MADDGALVIYLDVPCEANAYVDAYVEVRQAKAKGSTASTAYGTTYNVGACIDGELRIETRAYPYDGRIQSGKLAITATVYIYGAEYSMSIRTSTGQVKGSDVRDLGNYVNDPDSPLTIDAVTRTADGLAVTVTIDDCPSGAYVNAYGDAAALDKQASANQLSGYLDTTCSGGPETFDIRFTGALDSKNVGIHVAAYVETMFSWEYYENAGEFRLRKK